MPKVNLKISTEDAEGTIYGGYPLPAGLYLCTPVELKENIKATTSWRLTFRIVRGKYKDQAIRLGIYFSSKTELHVSRAFNKLGYPARYQGRQCYVTPAHFMRSISKLVAVRLTKEEARRGEEAGRVPYVEYQDVFSESTYWMLREKTLRRKLNINQPL